MRTLRFALGVVLLAFWPCGSVGQEQKEPPSSALAAAVTYPDTPEGLQKQFEDILEAYQEGESGKAERLIKNFCLSDAAATWARVFGSKPESRLAEDYTRECSSFQSFLSEHLGASAKVADVEIRVGAFVFVPPKARPPQTAESTPRMNVPLKIYKWEVLAKDQKLLTSVDFFVYLDGALRFFAELPPLPTELPQRIRVGGQLMNAKPVNKLAPE